jgi:hypothetical protein
LAALGEGTYFVAFITNLLRLMFRTTCFLLLLATPVAAQAPLAPDAQGPPAAARTAADTLQAIHRLYARHRHIGAAFTLGALAADLTLAGISSAQERRDERHASGGSGYGNFMGSGPLLHFGFGGFAVIYGVVAAPVAGVGIQQLITYGPKREAKVLAQYEETHTLPKRIARKLRRYLR